MVSIQGSPCKHNCFQYREDDSCTDDKSLLIREQSYLKQKLIELKTEV